MYRSNAVRLYRNGWQTVPAAGKRVFLPNWPVVGTLKQTEELITKLAQNAYPDSNIGLPFGDACPAIAVDIDSVEHAPELRKLAEYVLGPTRFVRIGRAPRVAMFYGKHPGDTYHTSRIPGLELFAAQGSQMIIHGIHPDTKEPYRWEDADPLTDNSSELPVASAAQVSRFLNDCLEILPPPAERGYTPQQGQQSGIKIESNLKTRGLRGWEYGQVIMGYLNGMEPGNRDERLTEVVASLVTRGFSDEKICEVLEGPYVKRFAADGTNRRSKIQRLLRRTRRRFGGGESGVNTCF